jgi:hypothetical protein
MPKQMINRMKVWWLQTNATTPARQQVSTAQAQHTLAWLKQMHSMQNA